MKIDLNLKLKPNKKLTKPLFKDFIIKDTDGDKVYDVFDCRPFDPRFHSITPSKTMQERLKKLPILFSVTVKGNKYYRLEDKNVPKEIEILRQRFLSMIKKRPDVVGEIERKRPRAIIFTRKGMEELGYASSEDWRKRRKAIKKGKVPGRHIAVVRLVGERGYKYRSEERDESAGTTIHELEHVSQFERWKGKQRLQQKMKKGRYEKRKEEVLARKAEERASRKRYKIASVRSDEELLASLPANTKKYFMEHPEEFEEFKRSSREKLKKRYEKFSAGMERMF